MYLKFLGSPFLFCGTAICQSVWMGSDNRQSEDFVAQIDIGADLKDSFLYACRISSCVAVCGMFKSW